MIVSNLQCNCINASKANSLKTQKCEQQLSLNIVPIVEVEFDKKDRHQLSRLLKGLQYIFTNCELSEQVFTLLEEKVLSGKKATGRLGMSLWEILVLSCVKLNLNADYDLLLDQANYHEKLRAILGIASYGYEDRKKYHLQTVIDNVQFLDEQTISLINKAVVQAGHGLVKKNWLSKKKIS